MSALQLSTRGNELVGALKHAGEATAEELAERLGVTASAVRHAPNTSGAATSSIATAT